VTGQQARRELTGAALASLVAAAVVVAILAAEPFDHGRWLVAYLVLVGFLAQLLLGVGQEALQAVGGRAGLPRRARHAQVLLWNLGVIAVPVGVLAETRLAVVAGSLSLIAALASLAMTARRALAEALVCRSWLGWGYAALLAAMVASTLIGTGLAWDIPWT
jgi:hypothetical protein